MEIKEQAAFMIESLVIASYEFNLLTPLTLKYGLICYLGGLSARAKLYSMISEYVAVETLLYE